MIDSKKKAIKAIRTLLQYLGEDPDRDGLLETPERVLHGYAEMLDGYGKDPAALMKCFAPGSAYDEIILLKNVPFQSCCEHHLLPFCGTASIAYIPRDRVLGVSKLARLLDLYSHRLQIQERLCCQVTTALDTHLNPQGSACILEATHLCCSLRGVKKHDAIMVTSSLTGAFREDASCKAELMRLIKL